MGQAGLAEPKKRVLDVEKLVKNLAVLAGA
jgi:hypothetical protein